MLPSFSKEDQEYIEFSTFGIKLEEEKHQFKHNQLVQIPLTNLNIIPNPQTLQILFILNQSEKTIYASN